MNKIILNIIALLMLLPTISTSLAIQPQEKDIYLDTGGKLGHLIYMEQYYIKDNTNNLTLDESRIYFDGMINNSKITFLIIRPLDKQGNRYSEDQVRALATLNNNTILNTWYTSDIISIETETSNNGTERLIGIITIVLSLMIGIFLIRFALRNKKKKEEITHD